MPLRQRKKPFSAKQKKEQLRARRDRKKQSNDTEDQRRPQPSSHTQSEDDSDSRSEELVTVRQLNQQPVSKHSHGKGYDPNRYKLHFHGDRNDEVQRGKDKATQPLAPLPQVDLESNMEDIYKSGAFLDIPKRPTWDYTVNKSQLLAKEEIYFKRYLDNMLEKHDPEELSYFELNLETWRQLWRVLEMSDVVLLITDIRHPALHFSPSLYHFVIHEMKKNLVLILNKIDLAPASLVAAWRDYFLRHFPGIHIVCFTCQPRDEETEGLAASSKVYLKKKRKRGRTAMGPKDLLDVCQTIVQGAVDLTSWHEKITEDEVDGAEPHNARAEAEFHMEEAESVGHYHAHERFKDGILTIGCCGYPNVGKSSLMNGLVGKKVVSVSRTPGHTKHFQTIFLTPTVKLCDSPGLVFPSLIPKPMQVLAGIYPIAQVRDPYTPVGYLAQHIPLPSLLNLTHPEAAEAGEREMQWSALDICSAWAEKRGFLTAKAARPDVYRAGNHLLRLAVEGRLCLCTRPPGFTHNTRKWEEDDFALEITKLQQLHGKQVAIGTVSDGDSDNSEHDSNSRDTEESDDDGAVVASNPFALLGDDD